MPLGAREMKVADFFDLIGFDPRGVGRSTRLHCERIEDTRPKTSRPSDDQFSAYAEYARAHEDACQRGGKDLRPHISTANTARDMDVIRAALGEKKINYLGYSYGTYLGAVYGSLFPDGLNRSVLDSSMHPDWLWREQFLQQSVGVRFNVEQWAGWVAERDKTYHLGTSRQDVLATVEALATDLADHSVPLDRERPDDWPVYWPKEFDRTTLDSFLAQATQPRPVWDVTAEVVGELREAADTKTALSHDATVAAATMAADRDVTKLDPGCTTPSAARATGPPTSTRTTRTCGGTARSTPSVTATAAA
ncbi:alpha/beta fold hydrolase [Streptomyces sp. M19]